MNIIGTLIWGIRTSIILIFILAIIGMVACMILFGFYAGVFIAGSFGLEGVYKYACIAGAILMLIFPYVINMLFAIFYRVIFGPDDKDKENDDGDYEDEHNKNEYDVEYEYEEDRQDRNKKRKK